MTLSCTDTRRYLVAYLDDELDAKTSYDVQSHLESCAACAAERDALVRETQAIQRAVRNEPLELESLEEKLRAARLRAERPRFWGPGTLALAASALLVIAISALVASREFPGFGVGFAVRHHNCLQHVGISPTMPAPPGAMDAANQELKNTGAAIQHLPDMDGEGWVLLNGHKCRVEGRAFLHAIYARKAAPQETVSLFIPLEASAVAVAARHDHKTEDGVIIDMIDPATGIAAVTASGLEGRTRFIAAARSSLQG